MIEQLIGWVANIFFIIGVYTLGKKNVNGFYANTFANLLYVFQGFLMNNHALIWLSIGLIILNLKGANEWKKDVKMGS